MRIKDVINNETLTMKAPKPIDWQTIPDGYIGDFEYNGKKYGIVINNHSNNSDEPSIYSVDFHSWQNGLVNIRATNAGDGYKVMGIVANEARDKFIKEKLNPDAILVKVSRDPTDNTPEEIKGRQKLYSRVMDRFTKPLGFTHSSGWINSRAYSSNLFTKRELSNQEKIISQMNLGRKT